MKRTLLILIGLVILNQGLQAQRSIDKVDLFICTSGDHGQLDPAATVPFGMIKVGPDTDPGNHSGYNYQATKIKGFSHNRIGGVGCRGAGGSLRVLPGIGSGKTPSNSFIKSTEKANPGFYSVTFSNNINAALTAKNNTALHRYTFPKSDSAFIKFDLESSFAKLVSASKNKINEHEFTASISAMNVCDRGRFTTHFYVKCSKKPITTTDADGKLIFYFKTEKDEIVDLSVTASSLSPSDAIEEYQALNTNLTFEQVRKEGEDQWEALLSKIQVEGNKEYETLFYTHLYHIFLNPVVTENRHKAFRATNGQTYRSEGYVHYDSWSMWDNFRNKFSLYSIIIPDISADISNSLVDLYKYGKAHWSSYHEPVPTVRTEHTIVALLDFYRRGITNFDAQLAYNSMCAEIDNISAKTPDTQLEKAYDYWALSEFAKILDKPDDQAFFLSKMNNYKKNWQEYFSVMDEQSDIMHAKGLYEGTIWQYRWHVQFDIDGLIEQFGGIDNYTEQLEQFYTKDLYNHGNQPDIHVPFMFNYSSKPWLTQKWVNEILTKEVYQHYGTHKKWEEPYFGRIYKADPEGYIPEMDDDEGTMSGWYVLASMGLYPVEVGKPIFQLTSPIFEKVNLKLANGKTFQIIANNLSAENFYVKRITLNGEEYNKLYLDQKDILNGGKLVYELSNEPGDFSKAKK